MTSCPKLPRITYKFWVAVIVLIMLWHPLTYSECSTLECLVRLGSSAKSPIVVNIWNNILKSFFGVFCYAMSGVLYFMQCICVRMVYIYWIVICTSYIYIVFFAFSNKKDINNQRLLKGWRCRFCWSVVYICPILYFAIGPFSDPARSQYYRTNR